MKHIKRVSPFNPDYEVAFCLHSVSEIQRAIQQDRAYVNIQGYDYQVVAWNHISKRATIKTKTKNLGRVIIPAEQIEGV